MTHSKPDTNSKNDFWAKLIISLVGVHSVLLGLTIYFFTEFFYQVFFATPIENLFFVRQSGIFLFLIGLFYLYPLRNIKKYFRIIKLVILSKTVAVIFLLWNGHLTTAPAMIYLAAFFDGLMGAVLTVVYVQCRKAYAPGNPGAVPTGNADRGKSTG